jgi:single-strand DNA-binding protein
MNAVSLSGYLTHDPKLVYRNNRPICQMRLAVSNGKHGPTYIDMPTFDGQAYVCAEYLRKGSKVAVSGRLGYEEWRAHDGSKRFRYNVVGWVEFLDRANGKGKDVEIEDFDVDEADAEDLDLEALKPQLTFAT